MKSNEKEHYVRLRKAIGILTILVYPICLLVGFIFGNGRNEAFWWQTLSSQYFANGKIIYIGSMYTMFIFYILYKGYDWKDRLLSILMALSMICSIIFPSGGITNDAASRMLLPHIGLFDINMNLSHTIHCISGILIFIFSFINIQFVFTLNNGEMTENKKKRNIWYRVLSGLMLLSEFIACFATFPNPTGISNTSSFTQYIPTVCTALSLVLIGVCWLIKGEAIKSLNDK